jgi:putative IMPACT (imprinted ancient) family translation regulator
MKYLIETTEVYRCDSEDEAKTLIEQAKKTSVLKKYNCVAKEKKLKGEVVDSWYKLTLTKSWDDEKEPCGSTSVTYGTLSAFGGDEE